MTWSSRYGLYPRFVVADFSTIIENLSLIRCLELQGCGLAGHAVSASDSAAAGQVQSI